MKGLELAVPYSKMFPKILRIYCIIISKLFHTVEGGER